MNKPHDISPYQATPECANRIPLNCQRAEAGKKLR